MNDDDIERQIEERYAAAIEKKRQAAKILCLENGHSDVIVGKGLPDTPVKCNACGAVAVWKPAP